MARTRQDVEIAARVGRSAATVERHRLQGMWPADPLARIERHYEIMSECGLGSGRDNWAVAVDSAELFGWPTVLLRSVLTDPPVRLVSPGFHERIRAVLVNVAQLIGGLAPGYEEPAAGDTADPAEAVVDDAYRAIGKTVAGEPTEPADFVDLGEIIQTIADRGAAEGLADDEPETIDQPFATDLRDFWSSHVERFTPATPWAQSATPAKLAGAVAFAAKIVDIGNTLLPAMASTGDTRRAEIAAMAPTCGVILDVVPEVTDDAYRGPEMLPLLGPQPSPHPDEVHPGEST